MSEDKKRATPKKDKKDNKEEGAGVDDKTAQLKGEKEKATKKEIPKQEKQVKEEQVNIAQDGLDDLPEDVKKKLEKREKERARTAGKLKKKKKKEFKRVTVGKAYIKATYNNTIVTLTDINGAVISWASAGIGGFRGPKKATPYAAQIIVRIAVEKAKQQGLKEVSVYVRGVGTGRESAVRALNINGLTVTSIKDVTPVPHNGCRPKRPRRV